MSLALDLKGNHHFFFFLQLQHMSCGRSFPDQGWTWIPCIGSSDSTTGPPGKSQKPLLLRTTSSSQARSWKIFMKSNLGPSLSSFNATLSEDDGPSCLLLFILEVFKKLFKIQLLPESYFCLFIFLHLLCFSLMKWREGAWVSPQWNYLSYETVYCKGLP